jgi:hypothetical protein
MGGEALQARTYQYMLRTKKLFQLACGYVMMLINGARPEWVWYIHSQPLFGNAFLRHATSWLTGRDRVQRAVQTEPAYASYIEKMKTK